MLSPDLATKRRSARGAGSVGAAVVALTVAGYVCGVLVAPLARSRMFPWEIARATGIGAFLALWGIVFLGLRFRRPSRPGSGGHRQTLLRFHTALVPALMILVAAHLLSLLDDRYSGITVLSLLLPGRSAYRPEAVAYGTVALYLLVVIVGSAALAGRVVVRARWVGFHRLAYPMFALVWLHGVLAGSDTPTLRTLYVVAGFAVFAAAVPVLGRSRLMVGRAR